MKTTVAAGGAALLIVLSATAGCSGSKGSASSSSTAPTSVTSSAATPGDATGSPSESPVTSSTPAVPEPTPYSPPKTFGTKPGVLPPDNGYALAFEGDGKVQRGRLSKASVYAITRQGQLQRHDLLSAEGPRWTTLMGPTADPENPFLQGAYGPGAPVVSEDGKTVYAVAPAVKKGSGTSKDSVVAHVLAADAETGDVRWTVQLPAEGVSVPEAFGTAPQFSPRARVTRSGLLVVLEQGSVLLDPDKGTKKWVVAGTAFLGADGGFVTTATGAESGSTLSALDPASGKAGAPLLTRQTGVHFVGEGTRGVLATAGRLGSGSTTGGLYALKGGKAVLLAKGATDCGEMREGDTVLVCTVGKYADGVAAFDTASGKKLWELPTQTRDAPRHWVTWRDRVYTLMNQQVVVLDAKTGKDVSATPFGSSDSVVDVNDYGMVVAGMNDVTWFPATS